jgi:hypothetical protein
MEQSSQRVVRQREGLTEAEAQTLAGLVRQYERTIRRA